MTKKTTKRKEPKSTSEVAEVTPEVAAETEQQPVSTNECSSGSSSSEPLHRQLVREVAARHLTQRHCQGGPIDWAKVVADAREIEKAIGS